MQRTGKALSGVVMAGVLLASLASFSAATPDEGKDCKPGQDGCRLNADSGKDWQQGKKHGHWKSQYGWAFKAGLNLTPEQKDRLKADGAAREKKLIQLRSEKQLLLVDLKAAERQEKPDFGKIDSLSGKIGALEGKMLAEQTKGRAFFQSVLTPEQKKILAEGPPKNPQSEAGDQVQEQAQ